MSDAAVMPDLVVEDRVFSKLILGHNPLLGYSYLSDARSKEYAERFSRYEPIRDIIIAAMGQGVRSIMISTGHPSCEMLAQAIEEAQSHTGVQMANFVIVGPDVKDHVEYLRRVQCQVCLVHGQATDSFFQRAARTFEQGMVDLLADIRAAGFVPGMSSHNGGETIPLAEKYDVAVVNTPINKIAWRMCPCVEQVLGVVRASTKKIVAMKPLAMGRIAPQEGMDYIAHVAGVNGVCVGIGTPAEAEETFAIARAAFGG